MNKDIYKDIYRVDDHGIYVDIYKINVENNTYYNGIEWLEIDFEYVEIKPPNAKVAKWGNNGWIVVEEHPIEIQEPQPPTQEERIDMLENMMLIMMEG